MQKYILSMNKLFFKLLPLILFIIFVPEIWAATYDFQKEGITNMSNSQKITNPENYHYIYGFLGKGADTLNYYEFNLSAYSPNMQISLMIPESEKNTNFHPGMVIINPYLPSTSSQLPYGFPYGVSGAVYEWGESTGNFYNKEIMQNLLVGPTFTEALTEGNYKIAIFDPGGMGGRYVLKVGAKEGQQSVVDTLKLIWVIFRTQLNIY